MVDNLYVAERLGRGKVEEMLRQADQQRLQRTAAEGSHSAGRPDSVAWLFDGSTSTPAPKRA